MSKERENYPVRVRLGKDMLPDPPPFSACIAQNDAGYLYPFYRDSSDPDSSAWMLGIKDKRLTWKEIQDTFYVLAVFTARERMF